MRFPLLLVAMSLPLLSTGCATPSTPASIARTERPRLPTPPADLTRTERIEPLSAVPTGDKVMIDRGVLTEIVERLAQALAAIERGNTRIGSWKTVWSCTDERLSRGETPARCAP